MSKTNSSNGADSPSGIQSQEENDPQSTHNHPTEKSGEPTPVDRFVAACQDRGIGSVATTTDSDGNTHSFTVGEILSQDASIKEAIWEFTQKATSIEGTEKQVIVGHVLLRHLEDTGEFFTTPAGRLFYFNDGETRVYRVDSDCRRTLAEEFQTYVHCRYGLFTGRFSRNLGKDLKKRAQRRAEEREVYQFAHFNETKMELYVTNYDSGYYAVTKDSIEWRPNGTDVFFVDNDLGDPYEYIPVEERTSLPDHIPGEQSEWQSQGDALMRMFGNRINYRGSAALGPADQRKQLYLYLHLLPLIDLMDGRPILALEGEKGSGKSVAQRSIGRFLFGSEFTESSMPDSRDDFVAQVSNQPFVAIDNYDNGADWVNDMLASVATGSGIKMRKLFTTNDLHSARPRCWISINSRDPPFRRDDVADRLLVIRVERVDDFVGIGDFLKAVTAHRDILWSELLNNLQDVIREYGERETATMSTGHRMASWANMARIAGDALDVPDVDSLLDVMQSERAAFALEDEPWAGVIQHWRKDEPEEATVWQGAGALAKKLDDYADQNGLPFNQTHASALGSKLSLYRSELEELFGLEIDESGRTNEYRFTAENCQTHLKRPLKTY